MRDAIGASMRTAYCEILKEWSWAWDRTPGDHIQSSTIRVSFQEQRKPLQLRRRLSARRSRRSLRPRCYGPRRCLKNSELGSDQKAFTRPRVYEITERQRHH